MFKDGFYIISINYFPDSINFLFIFGHFKMNKSNRMKNIKRIVALIFGLSVGFFNGFAQEKTEPKESFKPHHILGVVLSHAQVFQGRDADGNKQSLSLPSWGIDYTYQFKPKWGIGLHTDIITETFEVEKHLSGGGTGEVIERSYPVAPALMGIYKPNKHWSFLLGAGMEFEKEENFFLNRAGVEYEAELPKGWEVFGSLSYDFKWSGYDNWLFGIGIAKVLGWHKNSTEPSND